MRSYEEFVQDVLASESDKRLGGVDFEATQQLSRDVAEYREFYSWKGKDAATWDSVRDVLAGRLAYANTNFDSTYLTKMQHVTGLGEGELMHRFTNDYKQRLSFSEVLDSVVANTETLAEKVALQTMSKEDYENYLQKQYEQDMLDEVQEDMGEYKRAAYTRVLEQEGFPLDTPYDGLPAYVTSFLDEAGIYAEDVAQMGFSEAEPSGQMPNRIYGDGSSTGRIYGSGAGRTDGLEDGYGENPNDGFDFE